MLDVLIIGGGPAGLSAALVLGRCLRRVLLCDGGAGRNRASRGVHNFLTRDGLLPADLRRLGEEELRPYETVAVRRGEVTELAVTAAGFQATLDDGSRVTARKALLATGVADRLPEIPGLAELYGRSVFHCPYCDGWENRGRPLAAYGKGARGQGLARELKGWSDDVVLLTDGPGRLLPGHRAALDRHGIAVYETPVVRLESEDGELRRIVLADGTALARSALFFSTGQKQACDLPSALGCALTGKGVVKTDRNEMTSVPGLYAAGDVTRGLQWAITAAAEGARAAFAINTALLEEDEP